MQPFNLWLKRLLFASLIGVVAFFSLYLTLNNSQTVSLDLYFYERSDIELSLVLLVTFCIGALLGLVIDFACLAPPLRTALQV